MKYLFNNSANSFNMKLQEMKYLQKTQKYQILSLLNDLSLFLI